MINRIILIAVVIAPCSQAFSQSDDSTDNDDKNHLKAAIQYISNQSYAGRTDSLKLPVIIPSLNFQLRTGFYLKASGYVNLSAGQASFDGISIEPGYEFSKNNWNGSISVIKNFISDSSNLIVAPIRASVEFYLENENKIITPSIGGEYVFSADGNDLIVYAGVSKSMKLTAGSKEPSASIQPSISVGGGTQSFYYSFLKNYAGNGRGKAKRRLNSSADETVQKRSRQFSVLTTELELPVTITKGKFEWKTTPALEAPLNLANKTSGSNGSQPYLYVSSEVTFTF